MFYPSVFISLRVIADFPWPPASGTPCTRIMSTVMPQNKNNVTKWIINNDNSQNHKNNRYNKRIMYEVMLWNKGNAVIK